MTDAGNGAFFLRHNGFTVIQHNAKDLENLINKNHPQNRVASALEKNILNSHAYEVALVGANEKAESSPEKQRAWANNYFKGKTLSTKLQNKPEDLIYFIDVDPYEPKTEQIDTLRDEILAKQGLPSGVIGIGGGSIMDIAKALSLMLTNEG